MTHTQIPALRPHMSASQEECENVVDNAKMEEQAAHSPASSLEEHFQVRIQLLDVGMAMS